MKSIKNYILLLLLCCFAGGLFAQTEIESKLKRLKSLYDQQLITKTEYDKQRQQILSGFAGGADEEIAYCHFITAGDEEIDFSDTEDDANLVKVSQIIKEILNASGNVAIFELRANRSIPNATAVIIKKKRFIQYNPAFVRNASASTNDWTIYGVFAHEIGHHINFHLNDRANRHVEELEADEFCGFILQKLGSTQEQAQQAVRKLSQGEAGSATHPARSQRLQAIEKGWKKASEQSSGGLSELDKKFHEIVDEADKAYDKGEFEVAQRRYERALSFKPDDSYVKSQIEKIVSKGPQDDGKDFGQVSELLDQYEKENRDPYVPPPAKKRGYVTVHYRGDNLGCVLNLKIRIGDREFYPSGSSFTVSDIEMGWTDYELSGTVSCTLAGVCTIYPQAASIEVINGAQLYIYWNNTAYATCAAWLSYQ